VVRLALDEPRGAAAPVVRAFACALSYVGNTDTIQAVTDPVGGSATFAYANNLLQSITDSAGRTTTFFMNSNSDVTGYQEPDGEEWTFTYQNHRMITKASPEGDVTTYGYSPTDGSLVSIAGPTPGETMSMNAGYTQPPGFDANGNPTYTTTYTNTHGVVHTVTLDEFGRQLADQYTANGTTYLVQHDRAALLGVGTDTSTLRRNRFIGRDARIEVNGLLQGLDDNYDNLGRWVESANADAGGNLSQGTLELVEYDANGRISLYSPGYGNGMDTFTVTRDANGRPTTIAESNGRQVTFTWNTNGTVQTSTVHGVTTTYTYDPATLNVATTSDSIQRTTTFNYDAAGNVASSTTGSTAPTTGDGATSWTFAHDANNRLTAATDALGHVTTLGYKQMACGCSEADLLTSLQTPDLALLDESWAFAYLPEGRLGSVTDPDGHAETYAYELAGELNKLVDRNGHTTNLTHDSLGRVLSITDAMSRSHARAYAAPATGAWSGQDVLSGSSSATAASTDFTQPLNPGDYQLGTNLYDTLGSPAGTHTRGWADMQFYRDATFQLSYGRSVDNWGRTLTTFDRPSSSLTSSTLQPSGSGTYEATHTSYNIGLPLPLPTGESNNFTSQFTYSTEFDLATGLGDYISEYTPQTALTLTRDTAGRVTNAETQQYNSLGGTPLALSQVYTYYPTGQLKASPQGTFTYDARGLVATRVAGAGTYSYGYDTLGRNISLQYPDLHTRTQTYDSEGRITSRCYAYPTTPATAPYCYTATYDPVGNPLTMGDPNGNDTITYDALDRVTSVSRAMTGVTVAPETYVYNALGALSTNAGVVLDDERPVLTGTGKAPAAVPNTYNGQAISMYSDGQISSLAGTTLALNLTGTVGYVNGVEIDNDMFQRVASDGLAQLVYTYDGANRSSTWKRSGSGWVQHGFWVYDGVDHPLEHVDETGVRQYYELDLAGNVRRLRGPAPVGGVGADLGGYRYTAFGSSITDASAPSAPTGAAALPVRWKGRWLMYTTGSGAGLVELYDMRARWWWPQGGVFVSVDGLGFHDSNATLWAWPGQNPYAYEDPSGHIGIPFVTPGLGTTVIGLVVGFLGSGQLPSVSYRGDMFVFQFPDNAIQDAVGATTTYGDVICYASGQDTPSTTAHELAHTEQFSALGDTYLGAHAASQLYSYAATGSYNQANPLESGPYSSPPHPWP
jgi:YD repeat-containing protein